MSISILATGDELIHGDVLNTNTKNIAHTLSSEGLPLGLQLSCGDKKEEIINCLAFMAKTHDILIVIGGLGPTTDDITRFALSEFIGEPLIEHSMALDHIKKRLKNPTISLNEGSLQQCLFPSHAKLLPNLLGSALGCYIQWESKSIFLLPGPPKECLPMFHHYVLPIAQKSARSQKQILKWRIFGLAESEIAPILENALNGIDCKTGYRWESPYIEFKVRCNPSVIQHVQNRINPLLENHIISPIDKKASDLLYELIIKLKKPITIIDEVTGGLLQLALTKPNSYSLLSFNGLSQNKIFFHLSGLNEYWQELPTHGTTQLFIEYQSGSTQAKETHCIPYRTALVIDYAVEWLCHRLFHLINQLHE